MVADAERAGFTANTIDTSATVSLEKVDTRFAITKMALQSKIAVPDIDPGTFDSIIQKASCPVPQVLKAKLTLDYTLN